MSEHIGFADTTNLTISLCLVYTLCIGCVRIWIRKGAFGADDLVILVATLFTLGHSAASYAALAHGLGIPWTIVTDKYSVASLDKVGSTDGRHTVQDADCAYRPRSLVW